MRGATAANSAKPITDNSTPGSKTATRNTAGPMSTSIDAADAATGTPDGGGSAASAAATPFHLSLNVADLERSVDFFRRLFALAPAKQRDDYAKFEVANP